jgi:hypothetical protein
MTSVDTLSTYAFSQAWTLLTWLSLRFSIVTFVS